MGFASYWCNDLLKLFALFKDRENDILRINYIMQFLQSEECIGDEMLNNKCLSKLALDTKLIWRIFKGASEFYDSAISRQFSQYFKAIKDKQIERLWAQDCTLFEPIIWYKPYCFYIFLIWRRFTQDLFCPHNTIDNEYYSYTCKWIVNIAGKHLLK